MDSTTKRNTADHPEIAKDVPQGLELGLRNYWYPVLESARVTANEPTGFMILGEPLVAWRDRDGRPRIVRDKCPHRAAKLSQGRVLGGDLQCRWHGLRFDGGGHCTLIPWEPEDSKLLNDVSVTAYPAEEIAGQIWAYLGDGKQYAMPNFRDCLPEELADRDEFIVFRLPDEIWTCNWLQALDGVDGFHAVMLHTESQAVDNEAYRGSGRPKVTTVPIEERRMSIVETNQGLRGIVRDPSGRQIHHGHILSGWKGERITLPALHTIPIRPTPDLPPYVGRHYQIPIDATHTLSVRFSSMRAKTAEERLACEKLWQEVVAPRQRHVNGEDRMLIERLGDLAESRAEEFLFHPDRDVVRLRRQLADAFLAQRAGHRPLPTKEALAAPI
jgi:phenylpropionate dioxygenase-like ring-hydroxylating dioxygenase large terminal subunit